MSETQPRVRKKRKQRDPDTGPFKATDEQIKAARERKPESREPIPEDYFLAPGEEQEVTIQRYIDRVKNPLTAIRAFCVACMGGYLGEVEKCSAEGCALYKFRKGKNPFHAKAGKRTPESDDDDDDS